MGGIRAFSYVLFSYLELVLVNLVDTQLELNVHKTLV